MGRLGVWLLVALLVAGSAAAQDTRGRAGWRPQPQMSQDERQRMREEMREVYRQRPDSARGRADRPERPRGMSAEERAKLRRDIRDANRELGR